MKICLVLISGGWGGAENVVYNMAKKLGQKANVTILVNHELAKYFSDFKNCRIFQLTIPTFAKSKFYFAPIYFLNELLHYFYYKRICKNILQFLKQQKVQIVHLHLEHSLKLFLPAFEKLDLPVVFTLHGVRTFGQFRPLERLMIRKGLTKVDKITCVSKYAMEVLENSGVHISNKPIVIYNGVDIGEIRRYSAHELPLEGKFKVLFPGGAKAWKGGDLLIESLPRIREKIPNVHVYFAGLLPKMHKLSKLVEERKLENSITFMGFLPPQRYFQVLSSTDVLVFPSMNEAFPMVLLEAMALGKPIVATNMGGIPEVIKDGFNGILVERDPKCIADAVIHLCDNRHLYEEISQNSLKTVESFDWDNIIDKYIELYRTLCGNSVSEGSM